jgi:N-acetylglucosamine-6-sulfatase
LFSGKNLSACSRPWFLYFSPHCPHTPAIPDTKYNESCANVTSPRIANYNWSNAGFHQLVSAQPPLTSADGALIDGLARRRCQTLLSIDDAYAALVRTVKALGVWDKTYWIVSSDHGYNLGHHVIFETRYISQH